MAHKSNSPSVLDEFVTVASVLSDPSRHNFLENGNKFEQSRLPRAHFQITLLKMISRVAAAKRPPQFSQGVLTILRFSTSHRRASFDSVVYRSHKCLASTPDDAFRHTFSLSIPFVIRERDLLNLSSLQTVPVETISKLRMVRIRSKRNKLLRERTPAAANAILSTTVRKRQVHSTPYMWSVILLVLLVPTTTMWLMNLILKDEQMVAENGPSIPQRFDTVEDQQPVQLDTNASTTMVIHDGVIDCATIESSSELSSSGQMIATSTDPSFLMSIHDPAVDRYISASIAKEGCFECGALQLSMAALQEHPNSILIDLGSNIGMYALTAAAKGHSVFAFEPVPQNYQRICQTLMANPKVFGSPTEIKQNNHSITLFRRAATATDTVVEIKTQSAKRNLGAFVVQESDQRGKTTMDDHPLIEGQYALGIPLDRLMDYIPSHSSRPIVLKIDVEGFECTALAGGLQFLRQHVIHYVSIEWSWQRLKLCGDEIRDHIFDVLAQNSLSPYQWSEPQGAFMKLDPQTWETTWLRHGSRSPRMDLYDIFWSKKNPQEYNVPFYRDKIQAIKDNNKGFHLRGNTTTRTAVFKVGA